MSINARQVIKDNLIPALTSLGGTASTADLKTEILRMTNTVAEDYGRTKPNKKYPQGRLSFVEKFTLVSVEMKRKGMVFTPAYAHLSLDQNASVAGKKKPTKIAENHKTSTKSTPVEVAQSETVVMTTGEELVAVKDESFALGDVDIDNQGNVGYLEKAPILSPPHFTAEEMIEEAEEIVEEAEEIVEEVEEIVESQSETAPTHVLLEDDEQYEGLETIATWSGGLIEAYLDRDNSVKIGIDAKGREWKEELTTEERIEYGLEAESVVEEEIAEVEIEMHDFEHNGVTHSLPVPVNASDYLQDFGNADAEEMEKEMLAQEAEEIEERDNIRLSEEIAEEVEEEVEEEIAEEVEEEVEEDDDSEGIFDDEEDDDSVVVASTFDEGEVISFEAPSTEDIFEDEDEDEDEDGISVNTDLSFLDLDSDEGVREKGMSLSKIKGHDLWGKVEGDEVYLSNYEDGRVTLKFEENIPPALEMSTDPVKADKLHHKLNTLKGDLEGYATLITATKGVRVERLKHQIKSELGCFGDKEWVGSICNTCALRPYCQNIEVIQNH